MLKVTLSFAAAFASGTIPRDPIATAIMLAVSNLLFMVVLLNGEVRGKRFLLGGVARIICRIDIEVK